MIAQTLQITNVPNTKHKIDTLIHAVVLMNIACHSTLRQLMQCVPSACTPVGFTQNSICKLHAVIVSALALNNWIAQLTASCMRQRVSEP